MKQKPTDYRNRIKALEYVNSADLVAHPGNWREHPAAQAEALKGVLAEVGIAGALLAYRSERQGGALVVIDGHLRKDAAPQAWPVLILDVDDAEADYLLAVVDPLAAMAVADAGALDALLSSVQSGEAAVQAMLAELAEGAGLYQPKDTEDAEPQVDRAEELRQEWGVEPGQLWRLPSRTPGQEHRLICGDCTDAATVERVMGGEKADAIITDPPYNVDKAEWDTNIIPMLNAAANLLPEIITDDGICFWFTSTRYIPEVIKATAALPYRWMFVWYPSNNMAHGDLGFQKFTAALVLGKQKVWRKNMQDLRDFPIRITGENPGHPTPKPVELINYLVEMASSSIVFDGFLGSGTTLISSENFSRQCRACEISAPYVSVALQRYLDAFGIRAELIT